MLVDDFNFLKFGENLVVDFNIFAISEFNVFKYSMIS